MSGWFRGDWKAVSPLNLLHMYTTHSLTPPLWCDGCPAGPKVSPGCPHRCGSRWVRKLWTSLTSEVAFPLWWGLKILRLFWDQWPLGDRDEDREEATFPAVISSFLWYWLYRPPEGPLRGAGNARWGENVWGFPVENIAPRNNRKHGRLGPTKQHSSIYFMITVRILAEFTAVAGKDVVSLSWSDLIDSLGIISFNFNRFSGEWR